MTTPDMPNEGAQQRYDNDDDGLHPDDVLITKWFPECTTLELLDRRPERWHMLSDAREAEADIKNGTHRVPPQVPWPKPPPRPRCELEVGIEEWRRLRLRMMDQLIAQWKAAKNSHPRYTGTRTASVPKQSSQPKPRCTSRAHRALHIAEIIEMIVGLLDPESMLSVRSVSSALRDTVAFVLGLQYRKKIPCDPISYHQLMPSGLDWMPPTETEISELDLDIRNRSVPNSTHATRFLPTARIVQAQCLPTATWTATRNMWNSKYSRYVDRVLQLSLDASDNRWLDFSQIKINPYLSHCFGDRAQETDGMFEIKLLSGPELITQSPFARLESLSSQVRPMHATQPPCKSLAIGVCISDAREERMWIRRLALIEAEDGVRIGQLVDALDEHATTIVDSWLEDVTTQRDRFEEKDWDNYSIGRHHQRHEWMKMCEVDPKIVVLLDGPKSESHMLCLAEAIWRMRFGPDRGRRQAKEWRDAFAQWSEKELPTRT